MKKSKAFPAYFGLWAFLRLLTFIAAAFFSGIRPYTAIEKSTALWPPTNLQLWLQRAFLAPWLRWDANWYVQILTTGYKAGDGTTSFHPLYLLFSAIPHQLGISPLFSLMLTSSLAGLLFFWALYKLARLDTGHRKSLLAVVLFASFPASFILFAPYTESLFLFFSTLSLYFMRERKWLLTALATFLASLTRQQGIFLFIPIIWYVRDEAEGSIKNTFKNYKGWLAAFTAPAGLFTWTLYRVFLLHEGTIETTSLQSFFYSALLSPYAKKVVPDQTLMLPWKAFSEGVRQLAESPQIGDFMSVVLGVWFLVLLLLSWKYLRPADRLYSLAITFVSFSMSTGVSGVYFSLPRHLFIAVPVFIGLAFALKKRWQQALVIGIQFLVQFFMLLLYVLEAWVP